MMSSAMLLLSFIKGNMKTLKWTAIAGSVSALIFFVLLVSTSSHVEGAMFKVWATYLALFVISLVWIALAVFFREMLSLWHDRVLFRIVFGFAPRWPLTEVKELDQAKIDAVLARLTRSMWDASLMTDARLEKKERILESKALIGKFGYALIEKDRLTETVQAMGAGR